jgi:hypothetical protein
MTVLLLVAGGGALPVADLEGEAVDGAGAAALVSAASVAPRAYRAEPGAALDVPGALAFGAGAERATTATPRSVNGFLASIV